MCPVAIQAKQNVSASRMQHAPDHFFPWSPFCHHVRVIKSSDVSCGARRFQAFSFLDVRDANGATFVLRVSHVRSQHSPHLQPAPLSLTRAHMDAFSDSKLPPPAPALGILRCTVRRLSHYCRIAARQPLRLQRARHAVA